MRVLSIADIQALEPGEAVPSFRAQLKEAKKYSSGDGEHGPWTLQNLVVMDATGIMQVKSKNKDEFTAAEVGQWFLFECITSKKHGMVGIKLAEDNYQGKSSKIIAITGTCKVSDGRQDDSAQDEPPARTPATPPAPRGAGTATKPPSAPSALRTTEQAIKDARERLGKAANLFLLCYDAAVHVGLTVMKKHPDVVFVPADIHKLAMSMSIANERNGIVQGLPTGPLTPAKKQAEPQPEPEPEPNPDDEDPVPF